MLEVHPPHAAVSSWRDFFIHIATIVIGLLIAVALENAVQRIHDRHELDETRMALLQEQHDNDIAWARNESDWRSTFEELENNLRVLESLRRHPGASQPPRSGGLRWSQAPFEWRHAVWDAARQKGIVQRMSFEEANAYQQYYGVLEVMDQQSLQTWNAMNEAHGFDLLDPDASHLSPAQLDQVIQLTVAVLQKHLLFGDTFGRFAHDFPARPHTLTWALLASLRANAPAIDPPTIPAPQ